MADPISVLIVDDNASVRQQLRKFLGLYENLVVAGEAGDGLGALEFLENHAPPDVILLDVYMPRLNGTQTVVEIMRRFPAPKILMFSVLDDKSEVLQALNFGAQGYLVKGISTPDEIVAAIQAVAGGLAAISPHITGWLVDEISAKSKSERQ